MAPGARAAGNLPAELTSFVGRRGELAEVRRLLAGSRLVTLTGVGGVGKTRLALRAAAGLRRAFRDGVWLVRLDQLRDEALVAQAVAGTLGLQDRAGYSPAGSLAEYLAGRQLLLVLDNCEHLVDATAKLADQLLRAAVGLRVLATSREALNIDGEMVLPVPTLPVPEAGQPLTAAGLGVFPAVRLFAERAAQVVPGFTVTGANVAAVAGICRRLEGLPLAIELAAARLPVLSPEQIDARLGDRLGLLTRGSRARPARQQTLRASIEWSYELCSPAERLLWARLSVFAGGFELDAAEGICADHRLAAGQVLELLAALAGKSILIAAHRKGGVRYRLPETLREFGQERLQESDEYTALRRRHRDWHEQLARRVDTGWVSPQLADWAARLFREHANVGGGAGLLPGRARRGRGRAAHRDPHLAVLLLERGACQRGPVPARPGAGPSWRAHRVAGAGAAAEQPAVRRLLRRQVGGMVADQRPAPGSGPAGHPGHRPACRLHGYRHDAPPGRPQVRPGRRRQAGHRRHPGRRRRDHRRPDQQPRPGRALRRSRRPLPPGRLTRPAKACSASLAGVTAGGVSRLESRPAIRSDPRSGGDRASHAARRCLRHRLGGRGAWPW
jgi:predicted ATPase